MICPSFRDDRQRYLPTVPTWRSRGQNGPRYEQPDDSLIPPPPTLTDRTTLEAPDVAPCDEGQPTGTTSVIVRNRQGDAGDSVGDRKRSAGAAAGSTQGKSDNSRPAADAMRVTAAQIREPVPRAEVDIVQSSDLNTPRSGLGVDSRTAA